MWTAARTLSPGALAPESTDKNPFQPYSSKKPPGALSSSFISFLGTPGWREEAPASRVSVSEGKLFAHLGQFLQSFFYQPLDRQRPQRLGPSTFQLLPRPQAAKPHLSSPSHPLPPHSPGPLVGTRRGSTKP